MTTLLQLTNRAQEEVGECCHECTWPTRYAQQTVIEAIRDYSLHFPRLNTTSLTTAASTRTYELPDDFMEMVSVRYPGATGDYLKRRGYQHDDFWNEDGYYDVLPTGTTSAGSTYSRATLYISNTPSAAQTIAIVYQAYHPVALARNSTVTVPEEHEHLILLFCVWKAWIHHLGNIMQDPDQTKPIIDGIRRAVNMAKADYDLALQQAKDAYSASAHTPHRWQMDDHDRIY